MLLRWAEGKKQSTWRREQSEKKKIETQSSKSKDVIDFIRVWFEKEGDWKQRPLVPIY